MSSDIIIRGLSTCLSGICWIVSFKFLLQDIEWEHGDFTAGLMLYAGYLTSWVTLLNAIVFMFVAIKPGGARAAWWIGQAMVANVAMLAGFWGAVHWREYLATPLSHRLVHGPIPGLVTVLWLISATRHRATLRNALIWPIFAIVYTIWMIGYGLVTDYYPYWQLNPGRVGWRIVMLSIGGIFVVTYGVSLALFVVQRRVSARYHPRRRPKDPGNDVSHDRVPPAQITR